MDLTLFTQLINNYNYSAARATIKDNQGELWQALKHVLDMQQSRLAFDFQDALLQWTHAEQYLSADLKVDSSFLHAHQLLCTLTDTSDRTAQELALIVELFRHLVLYLEAEDTASFLIRFYRAREAVLSFIARHYGIERVRTGSIHDLFVKLEDALEQNPYTVYLGAYFFWKSKNVTDTMDLRNRSFIGHGRLGFSEHKVWEEYSGYAMQTVAIAKRRFIRDGSIMLRDLGGQWDAHFEQFNRFMIQLATLALEQDGARPVVDNRISISRQLVRAGNYRAVIALLQPKVGSELGRLLTFAEQLQNCHLLTFRQDVLLVMDILNRHTIDSQRSIWCEQMLALEKREQRTFIYYLYSLVQLLDEREMMVDFIVVYFRLVEELLLYAIGWDVDVLQKMMPSKHRKAVPLQEGEKIATFAVFKRTLVRHVQKSANPDAFMKALAELVNREDVADVLELRHEGVSGHGFADLSRDRIFALSGGVEPLKWLEPVMAKEGLLPAFSVFRLVDEALLLLLKD